MALYGVISNGTTGRIDLASTITFTADFHVQNTFKYDSSKANSTIWFGGSANAVRINSATTILLRIGGSSRTRTLITPLVDGQVYTFKLARDGSNNILFTDENDVNLITTSWGTSTSSITLDGFLVQSATNFFAGELHAVEVFNGGVKILEFENTTGTGSVWDDIVGSNNGALSGLPTDDSQRVLISGAGTTITVNNLGHVQVINDVDITQHNIISLNEILQNQSIDNTSITQHNALSVNELLNTQVVEQVILTQAHLLIPNDLSNIQSIEQVSLSIVGTISVDELLQQQSLGIVTLTETSTTLLNVVNLSQNHSLDGIQLMQSHLLVVDNIAQQQLLDIVNFGGVVIGYLEGELSIAYAYNGSVLITNALTGETTIN